MQDDAIDVDFIDSGHFNDIDHDDDDDNDDDDDHHHHHVEFIPPLCDYCVFVVTALLYITVANERVIEQTTQFSKHRL